MKQIILLLLMISSFCLSAQSNSSLDIIVGIDYTYRYISNDPNSTSGTAIKETRDKREDGNINWRFGLDYGHRLNSRFVLKTGVRLMSLGNHVDMDSLNFGLQAGGTTSRILIGDIKFTDNYWFLEMPIVLRYEFSNKKFTPYAELGIAPAYFLLHRNIYTFNGKREEVNTNTVKNSYLPVQRIQLEGILAFGFNYNIKESLQLFGQPTFRYHLTKMWTTDLKEHLWSAGLEIGVRKWLN